MTMRQPPPGTLESVAEEISATRHRSNVRSSSSLEECQQRAFLTASGAFCVAFSAGLAVQVELTRHLPIRLRSLASVIPVGAAAFAGYETFRTLSARCARRTAPAARHRSVAVLQGQRRQGLVTSFRQSSPASVDSTQATGSAITSAISQAVSDEGEDVQPPQQHSIWNQNAENQSPTKSETFMNIIPVLP